MRKLKYLFILTVLFLNSCMTYNHGDFTVLSNKIVNTKDFDMGSAKRIRNVEGEDKVSTIIIFPTGVPKFSEALNNAFEKTDTDIMTDVNVKIWSWYIPYIYGEDGWTVKGDAIKTRKN